MVFGGEKFEHSQWNGRCDRRDFADLNSVFGAATAPNHFHQPVDPLLRPKEPLLSCNFAPREDCDLLGKDHFGLAPERLESDRHERGGCCRAEPVFRRRRSSVWIRSAVPGFHSPSAPDISVRRGASIRRPA
jgi:hypothetical protein